MRARNYFQLGMIFAFCLLLGSCARKPDPVIRIGIIVWPGYEGFFLARELGFYDQTPVKLVEYTSAPEVVRAFQNGALEGVAITADELLRLSESQPDVRAIALLDISHGADAMLVRPGIDSLSKLKGKSIGVEANAVGVYMLSRILELSNLEREDVRVVFVENHRHVEAFERKEVEAVITFEPHRTRLKEAGAQVLIDSRSLPGEIMDFLVVREGLIQSREEALRSILDGWFKAVDYIRMEPAKAAEIMAPREQLSPDRFLKALSRLRLPPREQSRNLLDPANPKVVERLQKMANFMQEEKFITNSVAAEKLLANKLH